MHLIMMMLKLSECPTVPLLRIPRYQLSAQSWWFWLRRDRKIPPHRVSWAHLMSVYLTSMHPMDIYLIGMHLTGMYLIGVHLIGVHLMGVHLMGVHLMG